MHTERIRERLELAAVDFTHKSQMISATQDVAVEFQWARTLYISIFGQHPTMRPQ